MMTGPVTQTPGSNLFLFGENPIQCTIKRKTGIALSSAAAEYISATSVALEILWLIKLLEDINLPQKQPITLYENNQSCIKMAENEKYTRRTKHIDIRFHAIKRLREESIIDMLYCSTKFRTADILTKPIPKHDFQKHRSNLKLLVHPSSEIKGEY